MHNPDLRDLLSQSFAWPREERIRREHESMLGIIPHEFVDKLAEQGVRVKRGFASFDTYSKLMVELSNHTTTSRVEVAAKKNGALPHLEYKVSPELDLRGRDPETGLELAQLVEQMAKNLMAK